jgi:hypothetical protein
VLFDHSVFAVSARLLIQLARRGPVTARLIGAMNNGFARIGVMPYIACDRGRDLPLTVTAHTPVLLRPRETSEVTISRLGGAKYLRVTALGPNEGATDAY